MLNYSLIIPSFLAGIFTFLAPCTLPLVPGYLGFISGVPYKDLTDPNQANRIRTKVFVNGLFYVIGFSLVFILLGSFLSLANRSFAPYRVSLSRIGGLFVIFFGLYLMNIFKLPFFNLLSIEKRFHPESGLRPGNPVSSLIFGATFAFGWTPCVGPILGSILVLAATTQTVGQGALLLTVFSLGLAVPFLLVALFVGSAFKRLQSISRYLNIVSIIGGTFLVFLGILLLTNKFSVWIAFFYQFFSFLNYERLLDFL